MANKFICVDSSFIVRLTTVEPYVRIYSQLWQKWINEGSLIIAPTLLYADLYTSDKVVYFFNFP